MSEQEKKVLAAAGRNDLLEAWAALDAEHNEVMRKKIVLRADVQKVLDAAAVEALRDNLRACGYVHIEGDVWVRRSPYDPKYADVRHLPRRVLGPSGYEVRISDGGKKGTKGGRDNIDPTLLKRALGVTT